MTELKYEELSQFIIKGFYETYNELGRGFLESVYQKSLKICMEDLGLKVESEKIIDVIFRGQTVGIFRADLIVENKIILELKAVKHLLPENQAQLMNYLKATDLELGFVMNFGDKPEFKRLFYNNERK